MLIQVDGNRRRAIPAKVCEHDEILNGLTTYRKGIQIGAVYQFRAWKDALQAAQNWDRQFEANGKLIEDGR